MTNSNQHIEDYLKYYLSSKFNPEFAILLQGEWGCGKTWFIKEFMKKHSEGKNISSKLKVVLSICNNIFDSLSRL
jgi:tRNA A37 threonylcarbamoyladenosine biosynthesis protein TsaE